MSNAYYSANVGAKLFMGASTATPLPAVGSDSFTEVPLLGTVKPPTNQLSVGFFSILNDANRRSVGGKLNDRTVPGNLVADWTETAHQNLEADSLAQRKRNWYILYPDSGARRDDFVGFISKWEKAEFNAGEDAVEHRVDFEISVDGAVTVTY